MLLTSLEVKNMFLRQRQYTYVNYSSNHLMWSQLMLLFGSNDQSDQVQWLISTFLMYHFICLICYYLVNVISFTQSRSDHNKRRLLYEKNNSMIVCIRKKMTCYLNIILLESDGIYFLIDFIGRCSKEQ